MLTLSTGGLVPFVVIVLVLALAVSGVAVFFIEKSLVVHGPAQGMSAAEIGRRRRNTRLAAVAMTLPVVLAAVAVLLLPG